MKLTLNGVELEIRRISQTLIDLIDKKYATPKLPVQVVDGIPHEHRTDEYEQLVRDTEQNRIEARFRLIIMRGVVLDLTPEQLAEVKELREFMANEPGIDVELDPDDKYVYVANIVIQNSGDWVKIYETAMGLSTVTESGIKENLDTFRG